MQYKFEKFSSCIHMYVMYWNGPFGDETCHLKYPEPGLNFQIIFQSPCPTCGAWQSLRSQTPCSLCLHSPTLLACCHAMKRVLHYMIGLERQLRCGVWNQETLLRKFTYGMAVVFKKCYPIWLRGSRGGQECASNGHLEIFSMSSGERQRKSWWTLKEQERYKRYSIGRAGVHEMNNRGTEDVQQRFKRWTTEVQLRPYTKLRIHNTETPNWII